MIDSSAYLEWIDADSVICVTKVPAQPTAAQNKTESHDAKRRAATACLRALGETGPHAFAAQKGAAAQYPAGFWGSMSATKGWAMAALSRSENLGVDIEHLDNAPLAYESRHLFLNEHETQMIDTPEAALHAFCAKEAALKLTHGAVSFDGIEIVNVILDHQVTVRINGHTYTVRCSCTDTALWAWCHSADPQIMAWAHKARLRDHLFASQSFPHSDGSHC